MLCILKERLCLIKDFLNAHTAQESQRLQAIREAEIRPALKTALQNELQGVGIEVLQVCMFKEYRGATKVRLTEVLARRLGYIL